MRPIASLSQSLLARKGQAKPAMRPQLLGGAGSAPAPLDDLGWNDMGAPAPPSVPVPAAEQPPVPPLPPVLVERAALTGEVARIAPPADEIAPMADAAPASPVRAPSFRAGKAAFTLRLPPDRHLRLRLASAVAHRSAQAIVTEALDAFLSTLPEVEDLARACSAPDRASPAPSGKQA